MFQSEMSFSNNGATGKPRRGNGRGVMVFTRPGCSDTLVIFGLDRKQKKKKMSILLL